jgi:hypothetical protein
MTMTMTMRTFQLFMMINMPSHIQRIVEANLAAVIILRIYALHWQSPETRGFQQAIAEFKFLFEGMMLFVKAVMWISIPEIQHK